MPQRGLVLLPLAALAAAMAGPSQAAERRAARPSQPAHTRPVDMGKMLRHELGPMIQKAIRRRESPVMAILDLESFALPSPTQPREAARAAAARWVLGALADPGRLDAETLLLEIEPGLTARTGLQQSALFLREHAREEGGAGGKPLMRETLNLLETAYARGPSLSEHAAILQAAYDGWVERWSHVWFDDEAANPRRDYVLEKPGQPETRLEKTLYVPGDHFMLDSPEDFGPEERFTAAVALDQASESLRDPVNVSWSVLLAWAGGLVPLETYFASLLRLSSDMVTIILAWSLANLAFLLLSWKPLDRQAAEIEALASARYGRIPIGEALGELYLLKDRADKSRGVAWSAALALALAGAGPRVGLWFMEQAWPFLRAPAWPYAVALAALLAGILAAGSLVSRALSLRRIERMAEAAIAKLKTS